MVGRGGVRHALDVVRARVGDVGVADPRGLPLPSIARYVAALHRARGGRRRPEVALAHL